MTVSDGIDMTTWNTTLRGVATVVTVDRRLAKPLYQQIYDAFRGRVIRGDLRAGQLVPSTRELARDLRVSRLPVLEAYAQLHAEGYFETRVGAGTFIADRKSTRLNSSHGYISYAVFCLKKNKR